MHINSTKGLNYRIRLTVLGVFHPISLYLANLYVNEVGFRWPKRVDTGGASQRTGKER
ncbi:hypothetical protein HPT29_025690 (plasmid) [Microvirga terrae]|uniref:Transposase n=1 Tax=Microvirga terrae TaxID=2740529 RepID=A0ABY5RZ65_9HYPH|nr:hypothetical protein [Microvirga terrae]UVF22541.1 hypothetical protein HPT29_025690 [Microvirga terrae]